MVPPSAVNVVETYGADRESPTQSWCAIIGAPLHGVYATTDAPGLRLWDLLHLAQACGLKVLHSGEGVIGHDAAMSYAAHARPTPHRRSTVYFLMIDLFAFHPIAYVGVVQNARQYHAIRNERHAGRDSERYELKKFGCGEEGRQQIHKAYWAWCKDNVFDDRRLMPAYHSVFRQQARHAVMPPLEVYPLEETSDGSPSNLCFIVMMLYDLLSMTSPSDLRTIAVRNKAGRLQRLVGKRNAMLAPAQQRELLRVMAGACAIIDPSRDIIVLMGLNTATAERIVLGVLESHHHVRSYQEATGQHGRIMNWRELQQFAERRSLALVHLPEYGAEWPARSLGGEPDGSGVSPPHTFPAFVPPPGVTVYLSSDCLPPNPPPSWSLSSCYPPTDVRYRPSARGYRHWVDDDRIVHVIYGPDTPLPLPPAYQHVHTMSSAEADLIAAASGQPPPQKQSAEHY